MVEDFPQLPNGAVRGIAYEDAMGGVSVDVCLDDDGDTDPRHLLQRHDESELVNILSESVYPMDDIVLGLKLLNALRGQRKAYFSETVDVESALAFRAVQKQIDSKICPDKLRVWVHHKDSVVRLTLYNGADSIYLSDSGHTDEGWFSQFASYRLDNGIVYNTIDRRERDCDGLMETYSDWHWPVGGETTPRWIDWDSEGIDLFDETIRMPNWERGKCSQRDHSAEAMGY